MKKIKLFYGWYIVAAALLLSTVNMMFLGYGWSSFVNPILTTFGWSLSQLSLASSLRNFENGIFNPVWGFAADRFSPKKLALFGTILAVLGIFCLSQTRNLLMFYVGFLVMGLGSSLALQVVPQVLTARWFDKNQGKANGILNMAPGIGGVAVSLTVLVVDKVGWQHTLLYCAIFLLVAGIPLSFVYRSRPSDYGMFPDGKAPDTSTEAKPAKSSDFGTSVKEALKMRAFWHICVMLIFQNAAAGTVGLFYIPYLTSLGMSRTGAASVFSLSMFASLFTRILVGILGDKFGRTRVMGVCVALHTAGVFVFWLITGTSSFWLILLFAITYGIGLSANTSLRSPILVEYFGRKNFGAILGIVSVAGLLASVSAPTIVGLIYDKYHDYHIWWLIISGVGVISTISIFTIPRSKAPRPDKSSRT
jgi:MFS family permease